jgi:hypothetical protein
MAPHLAPLLAGMLLVASPGPEEDDAGVPLTNAEILSAAAGSILGAAAMCTDTISGDRLSAATDKLTVLLSAAVTDDDELTSAQQMFVENAGAGKRAVETGRTDCRTVEASLAKLEQVTVEDQDEEQQ